MKIVKLKTLNKKSKKIAPNYSSWDALTQAKYLYDLGCATGQRISPLTAYELANKAVTE